MSTPFDEFIEVRIGGGRYFGKPIVYRLPLADDEFDRLTRPLPKDREIYDHAKKAGFRDITIEVEQRRTAIQVRDRAALSDYLCQRLAEMVSREIAGRDTVNGYEQQEARRQ